MNEPDDIFTKGGLAVFLLSSDGDDVGSGRYSHPARVPVYFGDYPRPVYVYGDDLRCPSCEASHDVPDDRPAKWVAANKALNSGLCAGCDSVGSA